MVNGGGKIICVMHHDRLGSMPERDLMHVALNDGGVHMVHGGRIMNPEAVDRLRDNPTVHVANKMARLWNEDRHKASQTDPSSTDNSSSEADSGILFHAERFQVQERWVK